MARHYKLFLISTHVHIYIDLCIDITTASLEVNNGYQYQCCISLRLSELNPCTVLVCTPLWSGAGWLSSGRFVACICQQQCNDSVGRDVMDSHVPDHSAIVSMGPEILDGR